MQYVIDTPPPLQFDGRRGRANTVEAIFGGPNDPAQRMPGSVQVRLKIKGYPGWRGVKGDMRAALTTPVNTPEAVQQLAAALSRRFYPAFREFFLILAMDNRHKVLAWYIAAVGTGSTVQVGLQDIFRNLVILPSSAYIVVHNHPSGAPTPSREDIALTEQLRAGGMLLGLQLLDHLIIGADGAFSSLAELGYI